MSEVLWRSYEEVAAYLLDQFAESFGLSHVEGKQNVIGDTGVSWEIDAKGLRADGQGFLLVECRRHMTSRLKQEDLAAIAFRIRDTGASGGILVTPLPIQEGAKKVAQATNVQHIVLTPDSTTKQYVLRFLQDAFVGVNEPFTATETITVTKMDEQGRVYETINHSESSGS